MISESRDHCQRYSGSFICAIFALTKVQNNFWGFLHFVNNSGRSSNITPTWVKLVNIPGTGTFQDTQELLFIHFYVWLEFKRFFQISIIFLIIHGIPSTSRQTQWNLKNIIVYKFWVPWLVSNILRKLDLCNVCIN